MFFNNILLALSVSIDSISIGITYGLKNTHIPKSSNVILFIISFSITLISIFIGHYISVLFSGNFATYLGSFILIFLGIFNIHKIYSNNAQNYDLDNSNYIDTKESIFLGLGLSADSICVGLGCGIIGLNDIFLPFLVAIFQLIFINCGNIIAKNLVTKIKISDYFLSVFSAFVLIVIGLFRLLF